MLGSLLVLGGMALFVALVYVVVVLGGGALIGSTSSPHLGLSVLATAVVAVRGVLVMTDMWWSPEVVAAPCEWRTTSTPLGASRAHGAGRRGWGAGRVVSAGDRAATTTPGVRDGPSPLAPGARTLQR